MCIFITCAYLPTRWHKVDTKESGLLDLARVERVFLLLGAPVSQVKLGKIVAKIGTTDGGQVKMADFVTYYRTECPTQTVPTAIFFLQTLALVMKDVKVADFMEILNLNVPQASQSCMVGVHFDIIFIMTPVISSVIAAKFNHMG